MNLKKEVIMCQTVSHIGYWLYENNTICHRLTLPLYFLSLVMRTGDMSAEIGNPKLNLLCHFAVILIYRPTTYSVLLI